ncbi:hypothetical protein K439DRAFT_254732 [Ramaria rubella]|nr:hypothetical protein K439DRAFT_254732 [Ramaria rubella]
MQKSQAGSANKDKPAHPTRAERSPPLPQIKKTRKTSATAPPQDKPVIIQKRKAVEDHEEEPELAHRRNVLKIRRLSQAQWFVYSLSNDSLLIYVRLWWPRSP